MNQLIIRDLMGNNRSRSSNIQIYHNRQFPLEDILDVLYPLFYDDYSYNDFIHMITHIDHVFCAYDQTQHRPIACALVNNAGGKGGLYLMLFGVRQSSQHHGVGTKLLKTVVNWAYKTGHTFFYLHVHVGNYKAIGLYEKIGFRKQEYIPDYYRNSSKPDPHAFRMVIVF